MARQRKQLQIAGTEQASIPVVEEAAEEYRRIRDKRMELAKQEATAQAALVSAMNMHGVKVYEYIDDDETPRKVVLAEVVKARVRKVKPHQEDDEDGGGEHPGAEN